MSLRWRGLVELNKIMSVRPARKMQRLRRTIVSFTAAIDSGTLLQDPTKAPRSRSHSKAALATSRPGSSSQQRENGHASQRARSPARASPPAAPRAAPFVPRQQSPSTSPTRRALQTLPPDHAGHGGAPRAGATAAAAALAARAGDGAGVTYGYDDLHDRAAVSPAPSLDASAPRIGYSQSYQFARSDLLQNPSSVRTSSGGPPPE